MNVNYSFQPVDWHLDHGLHFQSSLEPDLAPVNPILRSQLKKTVGKLSSWKAGSRVVPGSRKAENTSEEDTVIYEVRVNKGSDIQRQNRVKKYKVPRGGTHGKSRFQAQEMRIRSKSLRDARGQHVRSLGVQARNERPVGSAAQPCGMWSCSRQKYQHKSGKHKGPGLFKGPLLPACEPNRNPYEPRTSLTMLPITF